MKTILLPAYMCTCIRILEDAGYEAYAVGGCVRDLIRGEVPHDYDLATSARPEQVMRLFPEYRETGLKYGTVTVFVENERIEITTFRSEQEYKNKRKPAGVAFIGSITEDLSRRDFTMNAMAFHPRKGLHDPFSGERDIRNKQIRAVGEPALRFKEDALRILRAFRFQAQLGFFIEPETLKAASGGILMLREMSGERIYEEWSKILLAQYPEEPLQTLLENGFGREFQWETDRNGFHKLTACEEKLEPRIAAFFYLTGGVEEKSRRAVYTWLKFSKGLSANVNRLMEILLLKNVAWNRIFVKRLMRKYGVRLFKQALWLREAMIGENHAEQRELMHQIITAQEPYLPAHLCVNGNDLKNKIPAVLIGRILHELLEAVLADPKRNERSWLLRYADSLYETNKKEYASNKERGEQNGQGFNC